MASFFAAGAQKAEVSRAIAGAAEPPGAEELREMTSSILTGAFEGDFDVALERTAAYCRVIALGQAEQADAAELSHGATRLDHDPARPIAHQDGRRPGSVGNAVAAWGSSTCIPSFTLTAQ